MLSFLVPVLFTIKKKFRRLKVKSSKHILVYRSSLETFWYTYVYSIHIFTPPSIPSFWDGIGHSVTIFSPKRPLCFPYMTVDWTWRTGEMRIYRGILSLHEKKKSLINFTLSANKFHTNYAENQAFVVRNMIYRKATTFFKVHFNIKLSSKNGIYLARTPVEYIYVHLFCRYICHSYSQFELLTYQPKSIWRRMYILSSS
jgi:hypothetical protein